MITAAQLATCTGASAAIASAWLAPISAAMTKYRIITPKRVAAFLPQAGHESMGLTRVRENMNYTPDALIATFGRRITRIDANRYGRTADHPADQQMIANIVYAGRMDNGPMESGDGWAYRGGGPGQLTGRDNYARCGAALGVDLVGNPILIERPDVGSLAFAWFWDLHGLNDLADHGDIVGISGAINCGSAKVPQSRIIGLPERLALTQKALWALS